MNLKDLIELARAISENRGSMTANFSNETLTLNAMNQTLREELNALTEGNHGFERNRYDIFEIIQESVDVQLPVELERHLNAFVKVHSYGIADSPEITIKRPNKFMRERQFITLGTPAGHYEVFRLAKEGKVRFNSTAATGAVQIAYEDFLTGRVDWNQLISILTLGIEDRIYDEIVASFDKIKSALPTPNKATSAAFDDETLNRLIGIVEAYGAKATIVCTARFARTITEGAEWASEKEKLNRREVGYLTDYKGARVVVLPNSYRDETNAEVVLDDSTAYIVPTGNDPLFHVVLQGGLQMKDAVNADWSKELHAYQRFGVGSVVNTAITAYTIEGIK